MIPAPAASARIAACGSMATTGAPDHRASASRKPPGPAPRSSTRRAGGSPAPATVASHRAMTSGGSVRAAR